MYLPDLLTFILGLWLQYRVEHLPSMCEALSLIPRITKRKLYLLAGHQWLTPIILATWEA
jgi:hypothetical protein